MTEGDKEKKVEKEEKFSCGYCNKEFESKENLNDHLREEHNNKVCYFCLEPFEVEMPFTCRFCGKKFCGDHRLPEDHECQELEEYKEKKKKEAVSGEGTISYIEERKKAGERDVKEPKELEEYLTRPPRRNKKTKGSSRGLRLREVGNKVLGYSFTFLKYFIIAFAIFNYLTFIGVTLDLKRAFPKNSSFVSKLEGYSLLPARNETKIENMLFDLTNKERIKNGAPELKQNEKLAMLAKNHSKDMKIDGYFSHTSPEGLGPTERAKNMGIDVIKNYGTYYQKGVGENIAEIPITVIPLLIRSEDCFIVITNRQIAKCAFKTLKNSPKHHANMINLNYTEAGMGVYCNFLGCKVTQNFR